LSPITKFDLLKAEKITQTWNDATPLRLEDSIWGLNK
jgi:hypothetical protein